MWVGGYPHQGLGLYGLHCVQTGGRLQTEGARQTVIRERDAHMGQSMT